MSASLRAGAASRSSSGLMVRRLLPAVLLVPLLLGWLGLQGLSAGYYGAELALALFAFCNVLIFTVLILGTALSLQRLDLADKFTQAKERDNEARSHWLFESTPSGLLIVDGGGRVVEANNAAERIFGYAPGSLVGMSVEQLVPACSGADREECRSRLLSHPGSWPMGQDLFGLCADGREVPIEVGLSPLAGTPDARVLVSVADIPERKRAEQALRESEERFRAMAETVPDILFTSWPDGWIDYVTPQFRAHTGLPAESAQGLGWITGLHPDDAEHGKARWRLSVSTGEPYEIKYRLRAADGSYRWHLSRAHPIRDASGQITKWFGVCSDIDELVQAQEALIQAQKMEALGHLTGGVAHDFNNLLTIITGNLQMLGDRIQDDAFLQERVTAATQAATRGADLVRRLLAFSRRQVLQPQRVDLNALLGGMMPLLHRILAEDIEVTSVENPELWSARVDPAQLESAILNLVLNARDAMPRGGTLCFKIRNVTLDPAYGGGENGASPGEYVMLAVSDTGVGMSEETRRRAFEPFYTTKQAGKGSGLGLAMVYGFAKQSSGHVQIDSEPGCGSTVEVYLPREKRAAPRPARDGGPELALARAGETVLVVEDDAGVRALAVTFLRELGYGVREATDGPSALAALQSGEVIDLMFVDLVLPGAMGGAEVGAAAQGLQPGIKVLHTSGYPHNAMIEDGRLAPEAQLLPKPYTRQDLAHAVRRLLDIEPA